MIQIKNNPYLLLTPGPLSTTQSVKEAMLQDWCTWDDDYNSIIRQLRTDLVALATSDVDDYTAVLMQGSGTFAVESTIGSVIPRGGKLLVLSNGAYGSRIEEIADILGIPNICCNNGESSPLDLEEFEKILTSVDGITHVAVVHCETTTGMLNNIQEVSAIAKQYNKIFIVDAMSSFGGIPIDVSELDIDYLISSSNKCIQGVPGFGFVIAKTKELQKCKGIARSLALDLYDQWNTMEAHNGKWRYTSPTHVVRAFCQAVLELNKEGGINARYERYKNNQKVLTEGMKALGYSPLLPRYLHSPIITAFRYPSEDFSFSDFYYTLKQNGYVIYPGKVSKAETFRIGNIGDVDEKDIQGLLEEIKKYSIG